MELSEFALGKLPETITAQLPQLFGVDDVYFVPIRHHSPACALALQKLLAEVQPAAILIEGPDDLSHLIPLLQHAQTQTPVAILCQASRTLAASSNITEDAPESESEPSAETLKPKRSSFFPLCDYSPEWVALRAAPALGAQVALIDMPWHSKAWQADEANSPRELIRSQMEERHFAHSKFIQAMAQRLGCVDHHDVWDRLFELRDAAALADWRSVFADVFYWCAMARIDYEPQVLEADLSLPRERHMAAHIKHWRKAVAGPLVVVTGGFHTPELLRCWKQAAPTKLTKPGKSPDKKATSEAGAWLIRYSFERLDALNGYSAGMPAPGYYQQIWDRLATGQASGSAFAAVALDCLTSFAQQTRKQDQTDAVSTPLVHAAALQAQRLAELRGNAGPGRQDLLDAMQSCFVKTAMDAGTLGFKADVRRFLCGTRIGDVPPSAGSPPLIEDARRLARAAGVRLDDSTARTSRFDIYRKPSHRQRSRFFHAMAYLETDFAKWRTGPDFLGNSRLNLLFEEWQAAWSPMVEARLIELASLGESIQQTCLAKLELEEAALSENGRGRSASAAVILLLRACLNGLQPRLPQLLNMLSVHLDEDASLASVVDCGHRLLNLWRVREPLGLQQHPQLLLLLRRVWPSALFLLPNLAGCAPEVQAQAVKTLLSMRELGRLLNGLEPASEAPAQDPDAPDSQVQADSFTSHLARLATQASNPAALRGAASALLYLDGAWDENALSLAVQSGFGTGAQTDHAVAFLSGLMSAAPELLLRIPSLLQSFDALVRQWAPENFMAYLPELRQAFTGLRPQETADLAAQIVKHHGAASDTELVAMHYECTEADLQLGLQLQQQLEVCLQQGGLRQWLG